MVRPIIFALAENAGSLKDVIGETFAERAGVAGSVTLLGMVAIFVVLALLWGVIEVLHRVLNLGGKTETTAPAPAPRKQPAPRTEKPKKAATAVATAVPNVTVTDDGALVAVITAAVAAAMAEEGYQGGFRVVSFRRTPTRRGGR